MVGDELTPPAAVDTDPAAEDTSLIDPAAPSEAEAAPAAGEEPASGADDKPLIAPGETQEEKPSAAPENYEDFSLPEGFVLEGEEKETVHALFRELNLTQENAQKLVDYFSRRLTDDKERMINDLSAKRKEWRSGIRNRADFRTEAANVKRAVNRFLTEPDEIELFKDSWLSDHPVFWRVFSKIGAVLSEDTPLPSGGENVQRDTVSQRFPVNL